MRDSLLILAISALNFLSFREKVILEKKLDTIGDLAVLSIEDISSMVGRRIRSRWWRGEDCQAMAERSLKLMEVYGIGALVHHHLDYPAMVAEMFDPPYLLFYRGNVAAVHEPCISVVGTRKPSQEAAQAAFEFSQEAAGAGYTMVSGLAFGIDAAVHKGALAGEGKTVAVLPCRADGAPVISSLEEYERFFSAPPGGGNGEGVPISGTNGTSASVRHCRQEKQLFFRG